MLTWETRPEISLLKVTGVPVRDHVPCQTWSCSLLRRATKHPEQQDRHCLGRALCRSHASSSAHSAWLCGTYRKWADYFTRHKVHVTQVQAHQNFFKEKQLRNKQTNKNNTLSTQRKFYRPHIHDVLNLAKRVSLGLRNLPGAESWEGRYTPQPVLNRMMIEWI